MATAKEEARETKIMNAVAKRTSWSTYAALALGVAAVLTGFWYLLSAVG